MAAKRQSTQSPAPAGLSSSDARPASAALSSSNGPADAPTGSSWLDPGLPHEKLSRLGSASALSDGEVLAVLLGEDAPSLDLARRLLQQLGSLDRLARLSMAELIRAGVPQEGAHRLLAAWELGRRRQQAEVRQLPMTSAAAVAAYVTPLLGDQVQESCVVLYLNRAHLLLAERILSVGSVSGVLIDPKLVFREAVALLASAIVVCHNHPSGNLNPSQADADITSRLVAAGRLLDIEVLDHMIITYRGHYSFAENGRLR